MAALVLTDERRAELAALLDDEQRLQAECPVVPRYLDQAAMLPGAGDSHADAAFDLRFVHYVTGGRKISANPYWEITAPSVSSHEGRRVVNGGSAAGSARLGYAEIVLQELYAYAIPSPETLAWIVRLCEGSPIVEAGAGRGYWAAQLAACGLDVSAFDLEPPDATDNVSFPKAQGQADVWHPVVGFEEFTAWGGFHPDQVLFLCWPPGWGNPMASQNLEAFEKAGGARLIYIGEPQGGKTGDDSFFQALSTRWTLESTDTEFVSWWNLKDVAQYWVKK